MKLLYLMPHCSTGGMPQYTLKQALSFKDIFDISIIEVNYYGDMFVVQRNQFKQNFNFRSLYGKEERLKQDILDINPDIIHIQEVPETFLNKDSLEFLYNKSRNWNIVVTTHSSLTRKKDFTYIPDRIVAVNNWQKELFQKEFPETEIDMWEYPIEDKCSAFEKLNAKAKLGLDSRNNRLNILNVGLFTPGKNQGELFEIARKNPQNTYHFVGNQAPNFEYYWKPLMKNIPRNCKVWGETSDVDLFYKACDEFYFTSKFELNPIVIKEALSYGLPVKMRKLETYGDFYDNNPLVTYIND